MEGGAHGAEWKKLGTPMSVIENHHPSKIHLRTFDRFKYMARVSEYMKKKTLHPLPYSEIHQLVKFHLLVPVRS